MKNKPLDIAGFLKLVIDALNAAGVEYLMAVPSQNGPGENRARPRIWILW